MMSNTEMTSNELKFKIYCIIHCSGHGPINVWLWHNISVFSAKQAHHISVVTVAGIHNSVGGTVVLTCHRSAGGEYRSVSRLEIVPAVLECAKCSLLATVGGCTKWDRRNSLTKYSACLDCRCCPGSPVVCEWGSGREVGRTGEGGQCCRPTHRRVFTTDQMTRHLHNYRCGSEGQFSINSAQKDQREHCKTPLWRCWFGSSQPPLWRCWFSGSQPPLWRWKFSGRNNTTSQTSSQNTLQMLLKWKEILTIGSQNQRILVIQFLKSSKWQEPQETRSNPI